MIYFINARHIPPEATEVWFCVRSLQIYKKQPGIKYKHVSVLSPNLDLFLWARKKLIIMNGTMQHSSSIMRNSQNRLPMILQPWI